MKLFLILALLPLVYAAGNFTSMLACRAAAVRRAESLRALALKWERTATECDRSGSPDTADALRQTAYELRSLINN